MSLSTQMILERAGAFLCSQQDQQGAIRDQAYAIFDVWETANSIKSLAMLRREGTFTPPARTVERALDFIARSEVTNGLAMYNARGEYGDKHCVETSAEYLLALHAVGAVEYARPRVELLRELQGVDGRWQLDYPDIPMRLHYFPSVTGFALVALHEYGEAPRYRQAALDQLTSSQSEAGDWGVEWEYYGTPYYALAPITQALYIHGQEKPLARARDFLRSHQREDGSWFHAWQDQREVPSPVLQTALALRACHYCGFDSTSVEMIKARAWLETQQREDGAFFGGYFPIPPRFNKKKEETVYSTTQVIRALLIP